jgi:hypothetical protein
MAGSSDITNVLAGFMVGFSLINYIVQEINAVGLECHRHVCQYYSLTPIASIGWALSRILKKEIIIIVG